ncbi:WYL domain-containing protein [Dolichospermum circinale]|uniref:WYL domain-containing protein n=1 Tax=Dolichospermum circinale TaxID=109265 RepID=UPI0004830F82|nr:WYL domain-containing protein [Dolichospermum circinale]MDB9475304.1 WYL domain-containing protein [Dolichospermum circinale CS-537/11]MDB9478270.1 WYL domain-containing protein [Dolichospermum circinale CS-537/03]MDB9483262.1 WYL domain-containing protein [Dolichospermum circinale CS-537/05]
MSRKGQSITLSVSERNKTQLEAIALQFGMKWGDDPNISKLIKAIAQHELIVSKNNDWQDSRIRALHRCISALTDIGQNEQAEIIANLLLERSELSVPLRKEIEGFLNNSHPSWRLQVDHYILRQQPFQLAYQDAAERVFNFTVRYAKIRPHEKRQYLDCWCEETEGNLDIPELKHNWCFRLDGINEASVTEITQKWLNGLDQIDVEIHLLNRLAFAYQPKPEDKIVEWIPEQPQVKKVIRRISNTFWFIREIMQYSSDCIVVSPEDVRSRIKESLVKLCQNYDLTASLTS